MRIFIQWTLRSPRGWNQYTTPQLLNAVAKPEPTRDPRLPGNEDVLDQSRGWIHSVNVQGMTFKSFDHYHFAALPDSGLQLTAWNDDPDDFSGNEYAYVYTFRKAFIDPTEGNCWNVRQTRVVYTTQGQRDRLTKNGRVTIQGTEFRDWSEFVPPAGKIFHGIWCTDELHEAHVAKQILHGWREWTAPARTLSQGPRHSNVLGNRYCPGHRRHGCRL
jgi:hypothetical protein